MPSRSLHLPKGVSLGLVPAVAAEGGRFATGHAGIDAAFGGGLGAGRLHEVYADDAATLTGFAAMLALCAAADDAMILWVCTPDAERTGGRFYAPGFADLGGDPCRLVLVRAGDAPQALRAAADAARCPGIGAVVLELWGRAPAFDLTASRRLVLAGETSGVTLVLARGGAPPVPSAAETRWGARPAPSCALEADAPGHPMLDLDLLRRRAGPAGLSWRVEWNRDRRALADPALSGAVVPLSGERAAGQRRAG